MASFDLNFPPSRYNSKRPGYNGTALQTFFSIFPDDDACLAYLFRLRFDADPICSRCGKQGRWQRHPWQKHYFHPCGGICSPMKGTLFAHTQVPLQLWFYAMLCITNSAEGMSAPYLARHIGVSEPTAFHMAHRIRTQMALIDRHIKVGGVGKRVLVRIVKLLRIVNQKANSQNYAYLLVVTDEDKVTVSVLEKPRRHRIKFLLLDKIANDSICYTDCIFTYRAMNAYGSKKSFADFEPQSAEESPKQAILAHGLVQYICLSFHDQYRGVTIDNSWLYMKEYQFRFNRRRSSKETFWDLISDFPSFETNELNLLCQKNLLAD